MFIENGIDHFTSFAAELLVIQADLPGNAGFPAMITGGGWWRGYLN